jgi:hypothetical protein
VATQQRFFFRRFERNDIHQDVSESKGPRGLLRTRDG